MRGWRVTENVWLDPRFLRLVLLLGDQDRAVGRYVRAVELSNKFWCPLRQPIPKSVWEQSGLGQELIQVGLVTAVQTTTDFGVTEDGYYLDGTEERNAAWFQRRDAGTKGGQARASKRTPSERQANAKRTLDSNSDKTEQLEKIFALYPKRLGGQQKLAAFKKLNRLTLTEIEQFERAVHAYATAMRREGKVGTEYIKMFSSFANPTVWEEWAEQASVPPAKLKTIEEALKEIRLMNGHEESA